MTNQFIPYGRQNITDEDIAAVVDVLKSDFITQGPAVKAFEASIAAHCGVSDAVAVSNATAGLHLAYLALGLEAGDLLWTVPNTFVSTANMARIIGAEVDFVDVDPKTYVMDVNALKAKLQQAEQANRLPKIVAPVHFAGQSCDMQAIKALSDQYGFKIVEDAAHAIGGGYKDQPVGNCRYSDACVFSFHPVKIITTGEGGAVTCADQSVLDKVRALHTHGVTRDAGLMTDAAKNEGAWYYQQLDLGLNYRMTDIQAALGASQMQRLGENIKRRHGIAKRYDGLLEGLPLSTPHVIGDAYSAWHLYVIQLDEAINREAVFDHLRANDIGVNVHYIPVHTQPYYHSLGFKAGDFPNAENYYSKAISLPMFYGLTDEQQDRVVAVLKEGL